MASSKASVVGTVFALLFKGIALLLMVAVPLLGVWVASSLAAYANAHTKWVVASGLLLFPGLPLAWEGFAQWRRSKGTSKPRILTFTDRLVLRMLLVNAAFIVILLAAQPKTAFIALSARGDWFLQNRHGAVAERTRKGVFALANTLEWLYDATHPNPYQKLVNKDQPRPDKVGAPDTSPEPTDTAHRRRKHHPPPRSPHPRRRAGP